MIQMAGASAGTLYGRGVYIGEASTKADEYAFINQGEHSTTKMAPNGLRCMLICRTMLGRVKYNDEKVPADVHGLVNNVLKGNFDSILGDRRKCRGTFREFVVFDKDQLYPNYILAYKRINPVEDPKKNMMVICPPDCPAGAKVR